MSSGPMTQGAEPLGLPADFVWGAATAAYQIEGAATQDGRTWSIWDTFCRVPGAVLGGDTGDVACDHYHRFEQDVDLMAELGLTAYRLSISWPRVMPAPGVVNTEGLDFYRRLTERLIARGITPWVTLYHWDLPQWLEDRGGWADRGTVAHFAELARVVQGALGGVRHWLTLNEPWCAAFLGYAGGQHAPGRQEPAAALAAAHHLLLAHGAAVRALRAGDPTATVGITLNFTVTDPADPADPQDVRVARLVQAMHNDVFLSPVLGEGYPPEVLAAWAELQVAPPVQPGDLEQVAEPIDVLGVNYYHGDLLSAAPPPPGLAVVGDAPTDRPTSSPHLGVVAHAVSRGLPRTVMDWEVQPDGLRRLLLMLADRTGGRVPLVVTENGAAYDDELCDGAVHDTERTAYVLDHLRAVAAARAQGADVRGYFVWSLLDNFEWAWGYDKRFGIVHVDFATQERTIKDSGRAYAAVVASGTVPVGDTVRT